jgi:pyrroloquinoline quinone biosynthesis protein E
MGGWGHDAMVITPNGDVLPCQAASSIPGLTFDNVRDRPLSEIWFDSVAFNKFRGTEWMPEECRTCPLDRFHIDFGGCRCQALALVGDATAVDPVCQFSPHHSIITNAVDEANRVTRNGDGELIYRTIEKVPARS